MWYRALFRKTSTSSSAPIERAECVIIGAGVVGLAIARELSLKGREVLLLESSSTFGTSTSSRNSEVIHSGIYHPPLSLKSLLCVRGRRLLYNYCATRAIPHRQTGKLIVATSPSQIPNLNTLFQNGLQNGVDSLRMMSAAEAAHAEPELQCVQAIYSPVAGIVDSHSLMLSFLGEAENRGAVVSYNSKVIGGEIEGGRLRIHVVETKNLEEPDVRPELTIEPKVVINSAGLSAVALAKRFSGMPAACIPSERFARGCYFSLSNTSPPPFRRLIYPLPEDGGLGIHVTVNLDGQLKFGPNVEWINSIPDTASFLDRFDYNVNPKLAEQFFSEIRKYYPNMKDGALEPGYSGIRPKVHYSGQPSSDFMIQGEDKHGVCGLINLFGIESPGLTSSLAIAEYICKNFK